VRVTQDKGEGVQALLSRNLRLRALEISGTAFDGPLWRCISSLQQLEVLDVGARTTEEVAIGLARRLPKLKNLYISKMESYSGWHNLSKSALRTLRKLLPKTA